MLNCCAISCSLFLVIRRLHHPPQSKTESKINQPRKVHDFICKIKHYIDVSTTFAAYKCLLNLRNEFS